MRLAGASWLRVVLGLTLLSDIVQKRRQGYPHLETRRCEVVSTRRL